MSSKDKNRSIKSKPSQKSPFSENRKLWLMDQSSNLNPNKSNDKLLDSDQS